MKILPPGRELIGNKWVFKVKRDGRYRSRLVALGYTQIPGVDFTDNFSSVVHDVTLRIALVMWIAMELDVDQMDVETAFLEGVLDKEEYMYMKCPHGMDLGDDKCLEIRKGMYGLVQSARLFWKKMSNFLISIGFKQSAADQCLFVKEAEKGIIALLLYVDDLAIFGYKEDIEQLFKDVRMKFNITTEGESNDFLGCDILRDPSKNECWILQPHLVKKLVDKFGPILKKQRSTNTPGTPRQVIIKNTDESLKLTTEEHHHYISGVGSLLYLLKHSRPELSNPIDNKGT